MYDNVEKYANNRTYTRCTKDKNSLKSITDIASMVAT